MTGSASWIYGRSAPRRWPRALRAILALALLGGLAGGGAALAFIGAGDVAACIGSDGCCSAPRETLRCWRRAAKAAWRGEAHMAGGGAAPLAGLSRSVTSDAELAAALAQAGDGSTIRLAPGRYAPVTLRDRSFPSGLVLRSLDPERPALLTGLNLHRVDGVTVADLGFDGSGAGQQYALLVMSSRNVALRRLTFDDPGASHSLQSAVMLRESSGLVVEDSRFFRFWHGLTFLEVADMRLSRNEFSGLRTDGIRGGGVSDAMIENTVCSDFRPQKDDHPDCIQLWSTNARASARRVTIRDNLVVRGAGAPIQGVFVRDTYLKLPFFEVTITGNLTVGAAYNAVSVDGLRDSRIADNEVIALPDQPSWLIVRHSDALSLSGNITPRIVMIENGKVAQRGNRLRDEGGRNAAGRLAAWFAARPAVVAAGGPLTRRLAGAAPEAPSAVRSRSP